MRRGNRKSKLSIPLFWIGKCSPVIGYVGSSGTSLPERDSPLPQRPFQWNEDPVTYLCRPQVTLRSRVVYPWSRSRRRETERKRSQCILLEFRLSIPYVEGPECPENFDGRRGSLVRSTYKTHLRIDPLSNARLVPTSHPFPVRSAIEKEVRHDEGGRPDERLQGFRKSSSSPSCLTYTGQFFVVGDQSSGSVGEQIGSTETRETDPQ